MFQLPPTELYLFLSIIVASIGASALGLVQIVREKVRYERLLTALCSLQVTLCAVLLIFRAVADQTFPLTDVFESMLILMVFIGITFLFLSAFIHQVWFLSVMSWALTVVICLAAVVAEPAGVLREAVQTPWVIVHALSMTLSGAMILFAAAISILFLWSRRHLKKKQVLNLLGRMPNIERLEWLNLLGLRLSFVALTFGLVSGIGLVGVMSDKLNITLSDWLTDSKIVLIMVSWLLLLSLLLMKKLFMFSGKVMARATLLLCFLILFAFVGSQILCKSGHQFSHQSQSSATLF